ncbi:hypothetical protein LTS18_009230, partial [Coniosporium uncinatum]
MQGQLPSRKRPAPGTSPVATEQPQTYGNMSYSSGQDPPQALNDQYMDWDGLEALNNSNTFGDTSSFDPPFYATSGNGQADGANLAPTSNQL